MYHMGKKLSPNDFDGGILYTIPMMKCGLMSKQIQICIGHITFLSNAILMWVLRVVGDQNQIL